MFGLIPGRKLKRGGWALLAGLALAGRYGPVVGQSAPAAPVATVVAAPAVLPAAVPAAFVLTRRGKHQARVPFLTQRNLLVISARLNGRGPFNFLLDSGVGSSLLTSVALADSLGLRHGTEYRLLGVGGTDSGLRAYETTNVRTTLPGGVEAAGLTWLVLTTDVLDLSGYVGMPMHGILGADLFRSFVVTIHPDTRVLELSDPATYRPPTSKRWASLPLTLDQDKAYVMADVELLAAAPGPGPGARARVEPPAPLPLRLVLDTGAGHALSLETSADARLYLPAERLRTDLGRGLSGLVSGWLGRVASVRLGRYQLPQVLTSFPDSSQVHGRLSGPARGRQGNLGYEMLKRFTTVIDYPHRRLLLRPNASWREPFEHDMCGLDLLATGPDFRRYVVLRVVPGSPAAAAGIVEGEEVMSLNFLPASAYSLTDLSRLLHSRDGLVLFLMLRRPDGENHVARVQLKRQI